MARTAPVPNIPAIPGMNPGVFILGVEAAAAGVTDLEATGAVTARAERGKPAGMARAAAARMRMAAVLVVAAGARTLRMAAAGVRTQATLSIQSPAVFIPSR